MKTKPVLCFFVSLVLFLSLFTIVQCRLNGAAEVKSESLPLDMKSLEKALDQVVDIGIGRNFLTLMIELPQPLPEDYKLFALSLDRDRMPIRKVSGYTFDPEIKGKNQLWFYFVLFIPGGPRHELRPASMPNINAPSYAGDYVQFILLKGNEVVMKKDVRRYDEFGNEKSPLFVDMPIPPNEINGYLELKDYTFFAKNDFRKPEGYFIEGQIIGGGGTWNFFVPKTDIQGQEPEPQVKLQSAKGWLELRTGKTHREMEAIAPQKPYVTGWWDGKGYFHPQPVKIQ